MDAADKVQPWHDFTAKLQQRELLPIIVEYIDWQRKMRRARDNGGIEPAMPRNWAPLSINLDLTTACNYACGHCIDWSSLNTKFKHDHECLLASLDYLIKHGLRSVILIGGGEPTIYPKFGEIVRFIKERNLQVAIVSNGSRCQIICDVAGFLSRKDWVRLSLDAGSDDTFQRMHNPKMVVALEEICSWASRIRKVNPISFGFSFIIAWQGAKRGDVPIIQNIDEIVTAAKLARRYGFSYISFKPILTRYPSGAEVMDAGVIENFALIREKIAEAKTYETADFKVIESVNLKVLLNGDWHNFTNQPRICHMQAFRQVLSPLGLYNCPAHRGVPKARIAGKNAFSSAEKSDETREATAGILSRFDASRECKEITCLYNPVNIWLERIVKNEIGMSSEGLDQSDYFL
ncbi:radical SAM protein [Candidatus Wolfebacteria bacterium]|nr:radical SAM protein [Candidatus Wolfebacteria bacterium]